MADIDTGASTQESQGLLNPQLGTGEYASQKGMSIGRFRHVTDVETEAQDQSSQGVIGLQSGTNKFATQRGMSMGKGRGVSDMKVTKVYDDMDYM